MQKWEYAIGTHTFEDETKTWEPKILGSLAKFSSLSEMLNYMGEQGYELVSASAHVGVLEVVGEGKLPYATHERFLLQAATNREKGKALANGRKGKVIKSLEILRLNDYARNQCNRERTKTLRRDFP